jgi:hypothetical protein
VFGILDTIKSIKPDVQTYGLGACYSYASLILASGTKGKRHSMKNTRIMMSQPMGELAVRRRGMGARWEVDRELGNVGQLPGGSWVWIKGA